MKLLVTGGRDYSNRDELYAALDGIHRGRAVTLLIHGDATGADTLAKEWAMARAVEHKPFPADWDDLTGPTVVVRFRKNGRKYNAAAGGIRNQVMVDQKPDLVVAFCGGSGTADCVRRARRCGLNVVAMGSGVLAASVGEELMLGRSIGEPHHV